MSHDNIFADIKDAPLDPIIGLDQLFRDDPAHDKVNLVVGVYQNEEGECPVLRSVKEAERRLLDDETSKSYLPAPGEEAFRHCVESLLFGPDHPVRKESRLASLHTPGGTAALRIAAEFVHDHSPASRIWISEPGYPNHVGIFGSLGFELKRYRYQDPASGTLAFDRMMDDLSGARPRDVVILSGCCHNPTGADLTQDQWSRVAELVANARLFPLIDLAYLGFAAGVEEDAAGLQAFFGRVPSGMISTSFSKNFGLYAERTGVLTFVADDAARCVARSNVYTRRFYSSPPAHGSRIVQTVLSQDDLREIWLDEVGQMRHRLAAMRNRLAEKLAERGVDPAWFPALVDNRGMFALTRLDENQVGELRADRHIYMLPSGRLSIAGIRESNLDRLADGFAAVIGSRQRERSEAV